jgi:hypothetical protein
MEAGSLQDLTEICGHNSMRTGDHGIRAVQDCTPRDNRDNTLKPQLQIGYYEQD